MQETASQAANWATVAVTGAGVVVSIIALLIARAARGDSKISATAAQQSATASERSAAATEASISVAQESVAISKQSLEVSQESAKTAKEAIELTHKLFLKQNTAELHNATHNVGIIDKAKPDEWIVWQAVNAMDVISTHWRHGITDKDILVDSYWSLYKDWFDALNSIETVIPPYNKTGKAMLSPIFELVYSEMDAWLKTRTKNALAKPKGE